MNGLETNLAADNLRVIEELNRNEIRGKKTFALKFCAFVTILGYIANTILESSRTGSVYVVLSRIGKEACSLVCANKTNGG